MKLQIITPELPDHKKIHRLIRCVLLRPFQWWSRNVNRYYGLLKNWFFVRFSSSSNPAVRQKHHQRGNWPHPAGARELDNAQDVMLEELEDVVDFDGKGRKLSAACPSWRIMSLTSTCPLTLSNWSVASPIRSTTLTSHGQAGDVWRRTTPSATPATCRGTACRVLRKIYISRGTVFSLTLET